MTTNRALEIKEFLASHGWDAATHAPFAGDFSSRKYARLTKPSGKTAVLMDAAADQKSDVFVAVAHILKNAGIAAPEIYAADPHRGLILMQDFGTRNIGSAIDAGAPMQGFADKAVGLLATAHAKCDLASAHKIGLPLYNAHTFAKQAGLFLDHYIPRVLHRDANTDERQAFYNAWLKVFDQTHHIPSGILLRDFMFDNLMELPNGGVGVLDFQDAGIGPISYDIASLCEEVRRDGGFDLLHDAVHKYCAQSVLTTEKTQLFQSCIACSAQRHIRILGILARMAESGRYDKAAHMGRVENFVQKVLKYDNLEPVRNFMLETNLLIPTNR